MRGYVYENEYIVGFPSGSFGFNSYRVKTTTTGVAYSPAGSLWYSHVLEKNLPVKACKISALV